MFLPALVCSVCVSVTTITKKIVDGFVSNFTGGKEKTKFVFRYDRLRDVEITIRDNYIYPQNFAFAGSCTLSEYFPSS